jgi:hypothetical protein
MTAQKVATARVLLLWDISALEFMLENPGMLATPQTADTIKALTFALGRFRTLLSVLDEG